MNIGKTANILFIEDDWVTLTAYRNRLQQEGYNVQTARDGVEAMKKLSLSVPDLVILDLELPKFNGGEVLKFIRTNASLNKVPVLIVSTNTVVDVAREHFLEHANKQILKANCNYQKLLEAVQELLDKSAVGREAPPADPDHCTFNDLQIFHRFAHA